MLNDKSIFSVRVASIDDAKSVEALLKASYSQLMVAAYGRVFLEPALDLITRANPFLLASGSYYVAETADGILVGCGGWTKSAPEDRNKIVGQIGHLRHFATHPDWICSGVGRAIYETSQSAARRCDVKTLEVLASLNAEDFYAALGFKRVREVSVAIGEGVHLPSIMMQQDLT